MRKIYSNLLQKTLKELSQHLDMIYNNITVYTVPLFFIDEGGKGMTRYIGKRVLQMLLTLFLIMTILFILLKVTPGSPFTNPRISADTRAILEAKYYY